MDIVVSVRIRRDDNEELYDKLKVIPAKGKKRSDYLRELLIRGFFLERFERLILAGQQEIKDMLREALEKGVTAVERELPASEPNSDSDDEEKKWEDNMLRMYEHFNR
ncbi:MAG: hypothetical protein WBK48_07245 [Dethiobacteria bacterium]